MSAEVKQMAQESESEIKTEWQAPVLEVMTLRSETNFQLSGSSDYETATS